MSYDAVSHSIANLSSRRTKPQTSHILHEDAVISVVEALYDGRAWRLSRKNLLNFDFFLELLFLICSGLWDFDHDARMDFVDKRDASLPNPVYLGIIIMDSHIGMEMEEVNL